MHHSKYSSIALQPFSKCSESLFHPIQCLSGQLYIPNDFLLLIPSGFFCPAAASRPAPAPGPFLLPPPLSATPLPVPRSGVFPRPRAPQCPFPPSRVGVRCRLATSREPPPHPGPFFLTFDVFHSFGGLDWIRNSVADSTPLRTARAPPIFHWKGPRAVPLWVLDREALHMPALPPNVPPAPARPSVSWVASRVSYF